MKKLFGVGLLLLASGFVLADGLLKHRKVLHDSCEPGYQWVEEVCYKDVERQVCKIVPDTIKKKKWVYACKDDKFCIHTDGKNCLHGHCQAECPSCCGPYNRIQLVKKEIVVSEEPTTKCVVETVVEQVCYTVKRKVCIATGVCVPGTDTVITPAPQSISPTLQAVPAPATSGETLPAPAPAPSPAPASPLPKS